MHYVERNPVRAKLTRVPWTYRWSSAAARTGAGGPAGLVDLEPWRALREGLNWKELLTERDDAPTIASRRLNT